jgi:hypothetical protein
MALPQSTSEVVVMERDGVFYAYQSAVIAVSDGTIEGAYTKFTAMKKASGDTQAAAGIGADNGNPRRTAYAGRSVPQELAVFALKALIVLALLAIGGAIAAAKIQGAIDQIVATLKTEVASGKGIALADVADKVADIARDAESMPPEKKELLRRSVGTISREFSPVADAWIHSGSAK